MQTFPVFSDFAPSAANSSRSRLFEAEQLFFAETTPPQLEHLIHAVARTPDDLIRHTQRIYYAFLHKLPEHLFAALSDLFLRLQDKGQDFAWRMLNGTRHQLSKQQYQILEKALSDQQFDTLQTVRFSLFSTGIKGQTDFIQPHRMQEDNPSVDALSLAQDYIEYSQLEQAMDILEQTLHQTGREDIQSLLLDLYQSTRSKKRFLKNLERAQANNKSLIPAWKTLQQHFNDTPS